MGYSLQSLGDGAYRVNGVHISPTTGKYITQKSKEEHMSNTETVEVPVEALRVLHEWYTSDPDAYPAESGLPEILKVELPKPVQVGDTITGAQFAVLPPLSVAIDTEGDVWVRTSPGDACTIAQSSLGPVFFEFEEDAYIASDIGKGTLVHLGKGAE